VGENRYLQVLKSLKIFIIYGDLMRMNGMVSFSVNKLANSKQNHSSRNLYIYINRLGSYFTEYSYE
jgi:hypothetical protein